MTSAYKYAVYLLFYLKITVMKKTKIIATAWLTLKNEDYLQKMYDSWVNIIRFNFSHAKYEDVKKSKEIIDRLNSEWSINISTLLDTKWPEIRTWDLENPLELKSWDIIKIFVNLDKYQSDKKSLFCDYKYLIEDLENWDIIEIDSWLLKALVIDKSSEFLNVKILNDCKITSRRHVNLPWKKLRLPWITDKDKEDVLFAIENNFDFIAQSFVRNKENVLELKKLLAENNASHIKIISKIENQEWIDNLDEIILVSDWIMVARWDLGIEVPIQTLPIYQRQIITKCLNTGKFVIVATHLLETMIENPFPTRAEVSDVFNSVMQKADCLMLSWETATWKYPIQSIEMMRNVIEEAEKEVFYKHYDFSNEWLEKRDIEKKMLLRSAVFMADELNVDAILIFTKTGKLARFIAWFRPKKQVFAFCGNQKANKYMNILFWIIPIILENWSNSHEYNLENSIKFLIKNKDINKDSRIIVITDLQKTGKEIPVLEIINISEFLGI